MESTSADHLKRINRTLTYIDDHLGDPLDLRALASIACFSPFHFHRVFKRVAGVSPQEYVKRRRLEMAYHFLSSDSTLKVNEVSGRLGFSSPSNFARSFRARYAFAPHHLRSPAPQPSRAAPAREGPQPFAYLDPSQVRLETVDAFRVLFVRRKGGPIDPAAVVPLFVRLRSESERLGWSMRGARRIVIGKSIPGLVAPADRVFDFGIEIPASARVDDPDLVQTVRGGTYARYEYRGDPSAVVACWGELYSVWLKRSGLPVGAGFGFTVAARPSGSPPQPTFQLYQPIRAGGAPQVAGRGA
jgi:AraC family transcriptional regulator